jgi:flagellum-specific peptidoglycan hydrolase FlgJ
MKFNKTVILMATALAIFSMKTQYTFATETQQQIEIKGTEDQLKRANPRVVAFVKTIARQASESGQEHDLYASITIAQAILESGVGRSKLSQEPYNNLFGIKGSYKGNTASFKTKEDDGTGRQYEIIDNFRAYPSVKESIEDHDYLIRYSMGDYYKNAWKSNAKTPHDAARALQGTYATDTKYASKLISLMNDYNLYRFDQPLTERDIAWLESDSMDPWELPVVEEVEEVFSETIEEPESLEQPKNFKRYVKDHLGLSREPFVFNTSDLWETTDSGDIALYSSLLSRDRFGLSKNN